jgi:P27 family predicted phage terminase small subunit
MRGRKPVPTILAELHGRPSHASKPNRAEPKPAGELSDAPDWLTEDQQAGWAYALRCAPPGLLKRLDRGALAVWVVAEDLHRQASVAQSKMALLVKTPNTALPIQSPYLPIINRQALIMLKAASELGFTPVSRPRVFAAGPAPGEGLHGDETTAAGTLEDFLATDPDGTATIN